VPFFLVLVGAILAWSGWNGLNVGTVVDNAMRGKPTPAHTKGSGFTNLLGPVIGFEVIKSLLSSSEGLDLLGLGAIAAGVVDADKKVATEAGDLWNWLTGATTPGEIANETTLVDLEDAAGTALKDKNTAVLKKIIDTIEEGQKTGLWSPEDPATIDEYVASLQTQYNDLIMAEGKAG
jgi:hypothetical protein